MLIGDTKINLHHILSDVVRLWVFSPILEDGQECVEWLVANFRNFLVKFAAKRRRWGLAGAATWVQCYKTFFVRKLQIVCYWQAYTKYVHFSSIMNPQCFVVHTLGQLLLEQMSLQGKLTKKKSQYG